MLPGVFQVIHKDPAGIYRIAEDPAALIGSRATIPVSIYAVFLLDVVAYFPQASPGAIELIHILHDAGGKRIHDKRPFTVFLQFGLIADRRYAGVVVTFLKPGLLTHH